MCVIDAIPGTHIDAQLRNPVSHESMITEQPNLDTGDALDYSDLRYTITESFKPSLVQVVAAVVEVMTI